MTAAAEAPAEGASAPSEDLVRELFASLDAAGVRWALLRGQAPLTGHGGDVDLLVAPQDVTAFAAAARRCGFLEVVRRGHGTHRFYVTYLEETAEWLELDVVTTIAFGRHQEYRVASADEVLARRRRAAGVWLLERSDAFWALLLHYAIDGAQLDDRKRVALADAADEAEETGPVAAAVRERLHGTMPLDLPRRAAMQGDAEALAAVGTVLRRHDRVRANVIRTLDRIVARTPWTTARAGARGLVVAVLGPDGAGKSTLVSGLRHSLALTTRSYYLGVLKTTDVTRRLRRVMPGLMLVVRLVKFRTICARARRAARRGEVVLFDRYSYDAFLPVTQQGVRGPVSAWLILRACPPPDMTLVLDVPAEVMFARKGELGEARLADFRMRYLAMHSRVPGLRVLDASRHAAEVEKAATALIWRELAGARTGVA